MGAPEPLPDCRFFPPLVLSNCKVVASITCSGCFSVDPRSTMGDRPPPCGSTRVSFAALFLFSFISSSSRDRTENQLSFSDHTGQPHHRPIYPPSVASRGLESFFVVDPDRLATPSLQHT